MKRIWLIITYIFLSVVMVSVIQAQAVQMDEIAVQSWKTGDEVIPPQVLSVVVTSGKGGYQKDLTAVSGKIYRLAIVPIRPQSSEAQHWKVELREVTIGSNRGESLGPDLFYVEPPGEGLPNSIEQKVATFYPNDERSPIVNKTFKFIDASLHYPSKMIRKIKVESFLVTLTSGKVTFTDPSKNVIESWEISVGFSCISGS